MKPSLEVADIFRHYGDAYRQQCGDRLSIEQLRAMRAIEICRTAELGGHVESPATKNASPSHAAPASTPGEAEPHSYPSRSRSQTPG